MQLRDSGFILNESPFFRSSAVQHAVHLGFKRAKWVFKFIYDLHLLMTFGK